jgi:hypothetical protein
MTKSWATLGMVLALGVLTLSPATASAASEREENPDGSAGWAHIDYLLVNTQGIWVYTSHADKENPNGCASNGNYVLSYGHPAYKQIYAALLTAFASDKRVLVWVAGESCVENRPSLWAVQLAN